MATRRKSFKITDIPEGSLNPPTYPEQVEPIFERGPQKSLLLKMHDDGERRRASQSSWKSVVGYIKRVLYSPKHPDTGGRTARANQYGCIVGTDQSLINTIESVPEGTDSESNLVQKFADYRVIGEADAMPEINQLCRISIPKNNDPSIEGKLIEMINEYVSPVKGVKSDKVEDDTAAQSLFLGVAPSIGSPE